MSPLLLVALFSAVDFSSYRGLTLGGNLATTLKHPGVETPTARTVHARPALIQELDWRPPMALASIVARQDTVRSARLLFLDGALYQIVVTYERDSVEGMTPDDMVDAISLTYGPASKPAVEIPFRSSYGDSAPVLARWGDKDFEYNLVRTGDGASFALILNDMRLLAKAQTATLEALRLDVQEAPQRELASRNQRAAEARLALEKTRAANKPKFKP
jgi:hypothetical protein